MVTSNSSGKNSSSDNSIPAWEAFEKGSLLWGSSSRREQEILVKHFAPKVRYLALRLRSKLPKNIELGELISAGTLGLMEAFGKFQASQNVKFDTYAESRIRGAMLDELRRLDWFPRSLRQKVKSIDEAIHLCEQANGRQPTEEEIQQHTGLSEKDVRDGLEALQNQLCLSLDALQESFGPDILGQVDSDPATSAAQSELLEKMTSLIDQLTPREKLVLSLYYTDEMNMRETSEIMGITEGRVSQLHSQALARLRKEFYNNFGMLDSSDM